MQIKPNRLRISFRTLNLLLSIIMLTVFMLVSGTILLVRTHEEQRQFALATQHDHLRLIAYKLNYQMQTVVNICENAARQNLFLKWIRTIENDSAGMYDRALAYQSLNTEINTLLATYPQIAQVSLVTDRRLYGTADSHSDSGTLPPAGVALAFHKESRHNYYELGNTPVYYSLRLSAEPSGRLDLFIYMDSQIIFDFGSSRDSIRIYDRDGELVFGKPELPALTDESRLFEQICVNQWNISFIPDFSTENRAFRNIFITAAVSGLAILTLSFILMRTFWKKLMQPFHSFTAQLDLYHSAPSENNFASPVQENKGRSDMRADRDSSQSKGRYRRSRTLAFSLLIFYLATVFLPTLIFIATFSLGAYRETQYRQIRTIHSEMENLCVQLGQRLNTLSTYAVQFTYQHELTHLLQTGSKEQLLKYWSEIRQPDFIFGKVEIEIYTSEPELLVSTSPVAPAATAGRPQGALPAWRMEENSLGQPCLALYYTSRTGNTFLRFTVSRTALLQGIEDEQRKVLQAQEISPALHYFVVTEPAADAGAHAQALKGQSLFSAQRVVFRYQIKGTEWYLVQAQDFISVPRQIAYVFISNNGIMIIVLCVIILAIYIISRLVLNPLRQLAQVLQRFSPGEGQMAGAGNLISEIDAIQISFNNMSQRVDELIDDLIRLHRRQRISESRRQNAEMTALQAQINPHFLSNTFSIIVANLTEGNVEQTHLLLNSLSDMFRYGINRRGQWVDVNDELRYARAYADIMSARYPDIKFFWEVDNRALSFPCIKLILQPLIENAIQHGLRENRFAGTVSISVQLRSAAFSDQERTLYFRICNDGTVIPPARLAQLRHILSQAPEDIDPDFDGIGLLNVQTRLQLAYGTQYGVTIEQSVQGLTAVSLTMPAEPEDTLLLASDPD